MATLHFHRLVERSVLGSLFWCAAVGLIYFFLNLCLYFFICVTGEEATPSLDLGQTDTDATPPYLALGLTDRGQTSVTSPQTEWHTAQPTTPSWNLGLTDTETTPLSLKLGLIDRGHASFTRPGTDRHHDFFDVTNIFFPALSPKHTHQPLLDRRDKHPGPWHPTWLQCSWLHRVRAASQLSETHHALLLLTCALYQR